MCHAALHVLVLPVTAKKMIWTMSIVNRTIYIYVAMLQPRLYFFMALQTLRAVLQKTLLSLATMADVLWRKY